MKFRSELDWTSPFPSISYDSKIMFLGSCFSENIGEIFQNLKFQSTVNPNGILFHPLAISKVLNHALNEEKFNEKHLVKRDNIFYSWLHHSSICGFNKTEYLEALNSSIFDLSHQLNTSDFLFITFGTAWGYFHSDNNEIVANCHKQPANLFIKKLAPIGEMVTVYEQLLSQLIERNPKLKIYLSISPVKHLKDGIIENSRSKSVLISAAHIICDKLEQVNYIPAYEWVVDDLRDYRFFKEDLAHPNELAVTYIWEKLIDTLFDSNTKKTIRDVQVILQSIEHKAFQPKSEEHQKFISHTIHKINQLPEALVYSFSNELNHLKAQLT